MSKPMCKVKKKLRVSKKETLSLYPDARFSCQKCGRVAICKKTICKPSKTA